jgi:hypothetical protein
MGTIKEISVKIRLKKTRKPAISPATRKFSLATFL